MPRKKQSKQVAGLAQTKGRRFFRPRAGWLAGLSLIVLLILFGRAIPAWYARQAAIRELQIGAVTGAQAWLSWSAWLDPGEGRTDLVEAACFRHLQVVDRFDQALESARRKGAPAALIERELKLGLIRAGGLESDDAGEIGPLIEAGLPPNEVAAAFVFGFLIRGEPEQARRILDAWGADRPDEAVVAYMRGVYWEHVEEAAKAQTEFEKALTRQPRFELARMALAGLFERRDQLQTAYRQYWEWAARFPASDAAQSGLARILRKMGRLDDARAVLESKASRSDVSETVAVEMAQIELESANYEQADQWFQRTRIDRIDDHQLEIAAATTLALTGEVILADERFVRADAVYRREQRIGDLLVRLRINPNDATATAELERMSLPQSDASVGLKRLPTQEVAENRRRMPGATASDLYLLHCSTCHGTEGDGNGHAARHLYPRPRDLRNDHSRLVSSGNGVASLDDLQAVIRRGMPGTAMRAFDQLPDSELRLLAEEVLRLNQEGVRERFIRELASEGEEIDEDEVRQVVEFATTPGEPVRVPPIGPIDSESAARGRVAYVTLGCIKCHGDDGSGAWDTPLFDEQGEWAMPRDLVHDPLKGGREPASIYLRIVNGMPGTPHPSCRNVPEGQSVDLVQYCRSIAAREEQSTNYQRLARVRSRMRFTEPEGDPVQ